MCAIQWLAIPTQSYHAPSCAVCRTEFFQEAPSHQHYQGAYAIANEISAFVLTGGRDWPPYPNAPGEPSPNVATSNPAQELPGLSQSRWAPQVDEDTASSHASGIVPNDTSEAVGHYEETEPSSDPLHGSTYARLQDMVYSMDHIRASLDDLRDQANEAMEDMRLRNEEQEEVSDALQSIRDDGWWVSSTSQDHQVYYSSGMSEHWHLFENEEWPDFSLLPGADVVDRSRE
jgi:hypothetical protein